MTRTPFSSVIIGAVLIVAATAVGKTQQAPQAAPVGPFAQEKYKDIRVLKDVPAADLDVTMQYFVAATGLNCTSCHVRDQATGVFSFEKDTDNKTTARGMIQLVQTVNAADFGARINCATCHQGANRPAGLQAAQMMTRAQLEAMAAQQAARQGGAGPGGARAGGPPAGGPPVGQAPAGGRQGGGRGNQTPLPPADPIIDQFITALGGQARLDALQSRIINGTVVNRANQSMPFTIEEKGTMFLSTLTTPQGVRATGFDGTNGWGQNGATIADLDGFRLQQAMRLNDLRRAADFRTRYTNIQAGRATRLPARTPGGPQINVNLVSGLAAPNVTERLYFDAASGLLLRRQIITRAALNGTLVETIDYSDYKEVAGVQTPFTITLNNWNTFDTYTVVDVRPGAQIDAAKFAKPKG
jgi:hypothetical protein